MCKYEVKCKCGHVGRGNYIVVAFPLIAEDGKEAARKARALPRVKHNWKDAIISVRKITDEEYEKLKIINDKDLYLKCSNKQEQNLIDLTDRIIKKTDRKGNEETLDEKKPCFYGKIKVRKPKKFFKNVKIKDYSEEGYEW